MLYGTAPEPDLWQSSSLKQNAGQLVLPNIIFVEGSRLPHLIGSNTAVRKPSGIGRNGYKQRPRHMRIQFDFQLL